MVLIFIKRQFKNIRRIAFNLLPKEENYDEAISLLEKHKHMTNGIRYLFQLGTYYQEVGKYRKAEEFQDFNGFRIPRPARPRLASPSPWLEFQ